MIGNARFAADGNGVLYSAAWEGAPPEIFETRTDLSTSRSLGLPGTSLVSVSRTGEFALRRGANPWAWGYGPLAVVNVSEGAPRDLLEEVSFADWSPDGTTLTVVRRIGGEDRLEMPPGHVLATTSGWLGDVRVSPDGRRIAFTEHPLLGDGRGTVAVVDTAGRKGKATLTGEFSDIGGLAWSPDGKEIWFSAQGQVKGPRRALFAVNLEGRLRSVGCYPSSVVLHDVLPDGRILLSSQTVRFGIRGQSSIAEAERELGWLDYPWPMALSADGRLLLFNDMGETAGPSYAVCLRSMDGSPPTRLGDGAGRALSPDGRFVLAIHLGPPQWLVLIPTGAGETLTLPHGSVETFQGADFLPDGRAVVFVGAEPGRPNRTWLQELADGLPRPVTPEGIGGLRTSPDGRWVAVRTPDSYLALVPLEGGELRLLAKLDFLREGVSQWSADGRTLFIAHAGTRLDVSAIDVQSSERRPWRTFEVPDPAGIWVWGLVMTRDARSYAYSYMRILDELYLVTGLK
jgi:Tol biopolymer transport system component